ncbi:hypothetical protein BFG07_14095 [Kosakonia cowanii]|uniref:hypothetical protein n=1 Tax=Kosakonia cowanii TaxID=208223 RepID=UPI000B96FD36|nr:hypothetical protein [Kosakonia cowanii]AST69706.1 hypothetical protein BFG07_14095 [Kosakonia cowanii]
MKIKCDPAILANGEDKLLFFTGMLSHRENHSLDVSNIQDLLSNSNITPTEMEYLKRLVVASGYKNFSYQITVTVSNDKQNRIKASQLNGILSRKAVLILENEFSDASFIEAVIKSQGKKYLLESRNKSWEIKGAGGCGEIPKHIKSESIKMNGLNRVVVVHDSDRLNPTSAISEVQQKIIDTAKEQGVMCCTLQKREIENYIPDSLISSLDNAREIIIQHFETLSAEQKDYYDYKIGFKKKGGTGKNMMLYLMACIQI